MPSKLVADSGRHSGNSIMELPQARAGLASLRGSRQRRQGGLSMLSRGVSPNTLFWKVPLHAEQLWREPGRTLLPCEPALGRPAGVIVREAKRSPRCDCG